MFDITILKNTITNDRSNFFYSVIQNKSPGELARQPIKRHITKDFSFSKPLCTFPEAG
ncbi:hypothetical protein [Acetobacter thailandicus]|uniref:hypothetical protein n=1 Tax=Acetobacter thailandicus TaxID=1502842 RepID=UPI001BA4E009|nr:hypothetical protein [Acetobacter thailandicus]MBS0960572.1 hypothetical protein [Acetobacter thailandicus]